MLTVSPPLQTGLRLGRALWCLVRFEPVQAALCWRGPGYARQERRLVVCYGRRKRDQMYVFLEQFAWVIFGAAWVHGGCVRVCVCDGALLQVCDGSAGKAPGLFGLRGSAFCELVVEEHWFL